MPPADRHAAAPDAPLAKPAGGVVAAIPARFDSVRLPGKVLRPLAGRPLLQHTWERTREASGIDDVVVLTDDTRVAEAVEGFGGRVAMTPKECASGTDRIAWAARDWSAQAVVNVQADEPLIDPEAIGLLANHLREHPDEGIATLAAPLEGGSVGDPNVVKVVLDRSGRALYFSRAPIPFRRGGETEDGSPGTEPLRHIGIYAYRRETLMEFAALPPSPLERTERLEQLRALENGIPIRVLLVDRAWPGVDTMEDLERVEAIMAERRGGGV